MRPTLRQLDAFVGVARRGSFTAAAAEIGLSQPALSQAISQLEAGLGVLLIQRTARSAYLTAEGEFLLPAAERILTELDSVVRDLRESGRTRRSRLMVGAMPSLAVGLMPHVMRRFAADHDRISVVLEDAQSEVLYRRVEEGQLDLAFSSRLAERPGVDFASLLHDRFNLVVPQAHPLAGRRFVRWRDLEEEPLIGFAGGTGTRSDLIRALSRAGIGLRPVMELAFSSTILGMVEAGLGVAALTSLSLPPIAHPGFAVVRLTEPVISREIGIVTASQRPRTPAAEAFIKVAVDYAATFSAEAALG
ncbi:LysR family transcriptional regulator [Roseomonas terrae]|jgi:LysR family carnitine catabolism transcriptional activator|uniref:LysR family transcriptional regulator n=1 Tax=Neoroseomonas terrae TaxID=424799 RepID=A0ABS5EBE8_9PROT|nr:LysR family transcriptional regulator [Neoroseomonas terrae]MBR0648349.1 LysR family transcriptional regulator [Neoroseomonas terrae]